MADAAAKVTKKAAKPKKAANHPKYIEMISQAITALKERSGSSRVAIMKYIQANFKDLGGDASANSHLKMALRAGVKSGVLKQTKGTGASGSFKMGEKPKAKVAKKPAAKKPKAKKEKKVKTPKKAAKKPKSPKKAAKKSTPKKAAKKPAAKKAVKKTPAKKAAKPKKAAAKKSPKKKAAAKKPAKK